jgi:hypothetical protein
LACCFFFFALEKRIASQLGQWSQVFGLDCK